MTLHETAPERAQPPKRSATGGTRARLTNIPLAEIVTGSLAMRTVMDPHAVQELAQSLSTDGLINPITVFRCENGYELIAGHRRTAAADALGWSTISAFVYETDPLHRARIAWAENSAREDVSPIDLAAWLQQRLTETGATQSQLARELKLSPSHLSELLAINDYPAEIRDELAANRITRTVARELARIDHPDTRSYFTHQAAEFGCTTATAAEWVRNWRASQTAPPDTASALGDDMPQPLPVDSYAWTCAACGTTSTAAAHVIRVCHGCAHTIANPPTL